MKDPRIEKLGQLLANYCVAVQPGDKIAIRGSLPAMPLVKAAYRAVVKAGGHPHFVLRDAEFSEIFFQEAGDDQLDYLNPLTQKVFDEFDGLISVSAENNTRALSRIDPAKQQRHALANRHIQQTMMRRSATGEFNWVGTLFPTQAHAQDADMSLSDFEDFVYEACLLNTDDPVAEWQAVKARHQILVDWLADKKQLQVKGENVDLTLSIADRTFINGDGRKNMPCGEIFTGPVEESVNGWIRYTYPAIHRGREVEGIELKFEDGKVVEASAKKNEAFLHEVLNTDKGARYLGEFAIGTNRGIQQFTKSILFDEKIGGTIHLAVGASYPESGGKNQSSVHWDMICDMRNGGEIYADGELFYDSGKFIVLGESA